MIFFHLLLQQSCRGYSLLSRVALDTVLRPFYLLKRRAYLLFVQLLQPLKTVCQTNLWYLSTLVRTRCPTVFTTGHTYLYCFGTERKRYRGDGRVAPQLQYACKKYGRDDVIRHLPPPATTSSSATRFYHIPHRFQYDYEYNQCMSQLANSKRQTSNEMRLRSALALSLCVRARATGDDRRDTDLLEGS